MELPDDLRVPLHSLRAEGGEGMSDDLVKRLRENQPCCGVFKCEGCQEAADRIEELKRALRQHACDCETCERTPEDRDDSCAANAVLKGGGK